MASLKNLKKMNTSNKIVLITGGGSGIGFQTAKLFSEKGSKVIIVGRNEEKLKAASTQLKNVDYFTADVTNNEDVQRLVAHIKKDYPTLNILINNAGNLHVHKVAEGTDTVTKAIDEINTNYISVINLTESLLPVLKQQSEAAVVNLTSIVALSPHMIIPTYSASKAALRSYTQILRYTLNKQGSALKIFEVLPPLVNTELAKNNGGERGIPAEEVAENILNKIESDTYEILPGISDYFYSTFFSGSEQAIGVLHEAAGE